MEGALPEVGHATLSVAVARRGIACAGELWERARGATRAAGTAGRGRPGRGAGAGGARWVPKAIPVRPDRGEKPGPKDRAEKSDRQGYKAVLDRRGRPAHPVRQALKGPRARKVIPVPRSVASIVPPTGAARAAAAMK